VNWVERRALEDDEFRRNGGEVWRNFKLALTSTIDSFNKIYTTRAEFQLSDCLHIDGNCFRIRSIPGPGTKEKVIEFKFNPEKHSIDLKHENWGVVPIRSLAVAVREGVLELQHEGRTISEQDASQTILEDFLFPSGAHREPLNPPKPDLSFS
jgi:hypothetical protein